MHTRNGITKSLEFYTSNYGKVKEARLLLNPLGYEVVWRKSRLPELQSDSLQKVAESKLANISGEERLAMVEDAGLFVHSLDGFPGVYSSYVFETIGCEGILRLLRNRKRDAHFESVVGVRHRGKSELFTGTVTGTISRRTRGTNGFGFDPIFVPEKSSLTMAELAPEVKARISHRAKALASLVEWLRRLGAGR